MGHDPRPTPPANYAQHPSQPGINQLQRQVMPPPGYRQPVSTPPNFQAQPPYPYAQAPGNFQPQFQQPAGAKFKPTMRLILICTASIIFLILLFTAPKVIAFLAIIGVVAAALFFGIKALRKTPTPPFR
jgi:hypothetical protein